MTDILAITSPIYLLIGLGFLVTRQGLFSPADMRLFGRFVLNLALPALLFNAVSQRPLGEVFHAGYLLAYAGGSLLMVALGYTGARRLGRLDRTTSAFYAMGMSSSNSGFVGFPILLLTLAPVAGVALALNMIVENLLVIPLLLWMAERGRDSAGSWRVLAQSLRRLLTNPLVLALVAGLLVAATGWKPPRPLSLTVQLLAAASTALSLLVIGGALVGLPLRGTLARVSPIVAGKLIGHPLAVWAALALLPLLGLPPVPPPLAAAAVLMAAMPMMGIYPTLAQAHGQEAMGAPALLLATVASFFSLSALLWLQGG